MKSKTEGPINYDRNVFIILLAVEIVLAFSSMGYIVIPPLALTFVHIPVLICALLYGPLEGAIAGLLFGLTSMWHATVSATAYADIIFSPFISGKPVESLILCIGVRIIFGAAAGWLFLYAKKAKKHQTALVVTSGIVATGIHTMLVYGGMQIFFPDAGASLGDTFNGLFQLDKFLTLTITAAIVALTFYIRNNHYKIPVIKRLKVLKDGSVLKLLLMGLLLFVMWTLLHNFYGRIPYLFYKYGVFMPDTIYRAIHQLLWQLFSGLAALMVIFLIVFTIMKENLDKVTSISKRDSLTGLYNRSAFIWQIETYLREKEGYLIIIDVDDFKRINDTYGHPAGDEVLIGIADSLRAAFLSNPIVGRLGGDEFSIFIKESANVEEVEKTAVIFQKAICQLEICRRLDIRLTCSMGIAKAERDSKFFKIYQKADYALYAAKRAEKGSFLFFEGIKHDESD